MSLSKKAQQSEATKQKLLQAVGTILAEEGFTGLKVENISRVAGVDKKLIYFHFGDPNGLYSEFLKSKDFWFTKVYDNMPVDFTKEIAQSVLTKQFETIHGNKLLNQLLVWELSDKNELLKEMSQERDEIGTSLINKLVEGGNFKDDVQPLLALLVAGIYYLSIHSTNNGSTFCGIDIKDEKDSKRLINTITTLIDNIK